jgi:hypothetical protein
MVTVIPEFTVTGPTEDAEYPAGTVYDVATVKLFKTKPLIAISALACNSPVEGLNKYFGLLV